MSETRDSSRLLEMLDALSTPDAHLPVSYVPVSEELEPQIRRYALNTLNESDIADEDTELEEQLVKGLAQQPRGLLLLRSLLNDVAAVEQLGPVPDELIDDQRRRILRTATVKPADFTVSLSKSGLRYSGKLPQRMATSYELARDPGEATTLLQHAQRLNHCEVKVTIEAGTAQSFTIVLEFTFVDPQYQNSPMEVTVADDAETVRQSQTVTDGSVEFENLPAGSFTIDIQANEINIDQFRAELRSDEQE